MELAKDLYRISTAAAKPIHMYLLKGEDKAILLDSGMAQTPNEVILPYIHSIGMEAEQVTDCIITHADCDHCGGNHELHKWCPNCKIHASAKDKELVEDVQVLIERRYSAYEMDHGISYDESTKQWMKDAGGLAQKVDLILVEGQIVGLDSTRHIEVFSLPGHTDGHVMIWEPLSKYAFIGDAILGHGEYDTTGNLFAPPVYVNVKDYTNSIEKLQNLSPSCVLRSHCDPIEGSMIPLFLRESRDWVEHAGLVVLKTIEKNPGISLSEIVKENKESLGNFIAWIDLMYPFAAHCKQFLDEGIIRSNNIKGVTRYWANR